MYKLKYVASLLGVFAAVVVFCIGYWQMSNNQQSMQSRFDSLTAVVDSLYLYNPIYINDIDVPDTVSLFDSLVVLPEIARYRVQRMIAFFKGRPEFLFDLKYYQTKYAYVFRRMQENALHPDYMYLFSNESRFIPDISSAKQAVGFGQFKYSTAKYYKATINEWIDDRRDPIWALKATPEYLETLYKRYNRNWLFALAAYNKGENGFDRILKSNETYGNGTDYFHLVGLPEQTEKFVPAIIALKLILNSDFYHRIDVGEVEVVSLHEYELQVKRKIEIEDLLNKLEYPREIFAVLNPQYINRHIPSGRCTIRVPLSYATTFHEYVRDSKKVASYRIIYLYQP